MKNNKGVTLIELIIVILIISVLAGGAMIGVRSIDAGNTRSSVNRVSALLNYVRVENMSKDKPYYLVLEKVSGTFYAKVQIDGATDREDVLTEKLKLRDGTITYQKGDTLTTENLTIEPPVKLELSYIKDTGAFRAGSDGKFTKSIVINSAGRTYTINLVAATGKHYME